MNSPHRYFIIYKPTNMVSQFVSPDQVGLLGDLDFAFPEGTHAIGRLDSQSEGLLLLTTNKKITRLLFESDVPHKRTYLVQVNNHVDQDTIDQLKKGILISGKGGLNYLTSPCEVSIVPSPAIFTEHSDNPSQIEIPRTWLSITLTEGKYHQVRKMVKAMKHRCKRLIRVAIEDMNLGDLKPGNVLEIEESTFFKQLRLAEVPEKGFNASTH